MEQYILIIGGGLSNKGAQAMSFSIINEIRLRKPGKKIVLLSYPDAQRTDDEKNIYNFEILGYELKTFCYLCGGMLKAISLIKHPNKNEIKSLRNLLERTEMIIDISGYSLSSVWGIGGSLQYLFQILCIKHFGIPMYLLPQSFGPFNYKWPYRFIMNLMIKKIMTYPKVIYARENEGYEWLTKKYGLNNVKLSPDLVLISPKIHLANVYKLLPEIREIPIEKESVAILPNMRTFDHGNIPEIMTLYQKIILKLLSMGMNVYLIRHSYEDIEACIMIKEQFKGNDKVFLLSEEFSCIEFERLVKKFNYLIASRYHSIVHAYKQGVPCVVLGWATKYYELLYAFQQEKYIFDVRKHIDQNAVIERILEIDKYYKMESKTIKEFLGKLQNENNLEFIHETTE